jgi:hypothetical protein
MLSGYRVRGVSVMAVGTVGSMRAGTMARVPSIGMSSVAKVTRVAGIDNMPRVAVVTTVPAVAIVPAAMPVMPATEEELGKQAEASD